MKRIGGNSYFRYKISKYWYGDKKHLSYEDAKKFIFVGDLYYNAPKLNELTDVINHIKNTWDGKSIEYNHSHWNEYHYCKYFKVLMDNYTIYELNSDYQWAISVAWGASWFVENSSRACVLCLVDNEQSAGYPDNVTMYGYEPWADLLVSEHDLNKYGAHDLGKGNPTYCPKYLMT